MKQKQLRQTALGLLYFAFPTSVLAQVTTQPIVERRPFPTYEDQKLERRTEDLTLDTKALEAMFENPTEPQPLVCGEGRQKASCLDYAAVVQGESEKIKKLVLDIECYDGYQKVVPGEEKKKCDHFQGLPFHNFPGVLLSLEDPLPNEKDASVAFVRCELDVKLGKVTFAYRMRADKNDDPTDKGLFGYRYKQVSRESEPSLAWPEEGQTSLHVPQSLFVALEREQQITVNQVGTWYVERIPSQKYENLHYVRLRAAVDFRLPIAPPVGVVVEHTEQIFTLLGRKPRKAPPAPVRFPGAALLDPILNR